MPTLTNSRSDLEQAIAQGIDFLSARQLPSGTFEIFCSPHMLLKENCKPDYSTFQTAQTAYCISYIKSAPAQQVIDKAIRFLLSEMQEDGVWRYSCSPNPDYLPPDVDDTACISDLFRKYGISFPDNTGVLLGNRVSDGLFYTWILPRVNWNGNRSYWRVALRQFLKLRQLVWFFRVTECRPNDRDPVVNANVLYYLGERPETGPIVRKLFQVLEDGTEETCDKYYGSRFNFYYFLSRNHAAGIRGLDPAGDTVVTRIKSYAHPDGTIGDHILHTAQAVCALMDWQDRSDVLDEAIRAILRARQSSGGWRICPFYYSGQSKKLAWGSAELTTGFCLEALSRYLSLEGSR